MRICTVNEMQQFDRTAVRDYGIPEKILMENAGMAVSSVIQNEIGIEGRTFSIICGLGNNGGDGFVVARILHSNYGKVRVFVIGDPQKIKGAARENYEILQNLPIEVHSITDTKLLRQKLPLTDCVVDAIFGTGIDRPVSGLYSQVIELINQNISYTVSVDIPSGINGDNGQVMGKAVEADYTVTFGLPKAGNLLYPGYEYCGKLFATHISFPPEMYDTKKQPQATNDPLVLPYRAGDTHKGACGKVLFVAGSCQYLGAPYFAAQSFLRAGGGLAFLATPENVAPYIATMGSEIVFVPMKGTTDGSISISNLEKLYNHAGQVDMVVIGPGLSLHEETRHLVRELITHLKKPVLIDGDGITAISEDPGLLKKRRHHTILTPHIGEMARLTGNSISHIEQNRLQILREHTKKLSSVIVLKGAHSLIGTPDGTIYLNLTGNPGMATAGSGDVLTGTIAAMYGLGLHIEDAVRMGVFLHGLAGDIAAKKHGPDGLLASDILKALPESVRAIREDLADLYENHYHHLHLI